MRMAVAAPVLLLVGASLGAGAMLLLLHDPAPRRETYLFDRPVEADRPPAAAGTPSGAPAAGTASAAPVGAPKDGPDLTPEERAILPELLKKHRDRVERSRIDPTLGGVEVVRRVKELGLDPMPLIASYDSVRSRIKVDGERKTIEAPADGAPVDLTAAAGNAAIIEFGPGTFQLDRKSEIWLFVKEGTRSLEIRGAGMDRTTIETGSLWVFTFAGEEAVLENLILRDLTIDSGKEGNIAVDARGAAAVALENVRIAGWSNAGHGAALGVSGSVFLAARGCEFAAKGKGLFVISLRGHAMALFEKCTFSDPEECVVGFSLPDAAGSAARFIDCTFRNAPAVSSRILKSKVPAAQVAVQGGSVSVGAPGLSDEERRRAFGGEWLTTCEGVTFGPGVAPCTVGEVVAVLDHVTVGDAESVYGVRFLGSASGGPSRYGIRILNRTTGNRSWRVVGSDGVDIEKTPRSPGGGWNPPTPAHLEGVSLASILRASPIPAESAVQEAALTTMGREDSAELTLNVRGGAEGFYDWYVQVSTGKILHGGPPKK